MNNWRQAMRVGVFVAILLAGVGAAQAALITTEVAGATKSYGTDGRYPIKAVNDSAGTSTSQSDMWIGYIDSDVSLANVSFVIDLRGVYDLDASGTLQIWNYNGTDGSGTARSIRAPKFWISQDGVAWTAVTGFTTSYGSGELAQGTGSGSNPATTVNFGSVYRTRYVRIGVTSTYGASDYVGLSEVQVYGTLVTSLASLKAALGAQIAVPVGNVTESAHFNVATSANLVNPAVGWVTVNDTLSGSIDWQSQWLVNGGRGWVQFDLGTAGTDSGIGTIAIWDLIDNNTDGSRAFRTCDILVSDDSTFSTYTIAKDDIEITPAPARIVDNDAPMLISMGGVKKRYVRISNEAARIGSLPHTYGRSDYTGLGKVNFYLPAKPVVDNDSGATGVNASEATLHGNLTAIGGSPATVGVSWGTWDGALTGDMWEHTEWFPYPASVGPFDTTVAISPSVQYWYRFQAFNDAGTSWAAGSETFMYSPAVITVTASDATAAENGSNPGAFTFSRTVASGTLDVGYTVSGTAENGVDYVQLSGTASFADGSATAVVPVTPILDGLPEGAQTVHVAINAGSYELGSPNEAEVSIADATEILFANNGNWDQSGNWNPTTVPSTAADLGVVPAGKTATANADLGSAGNRPIIRIEAGGRVNQTTTLNSPIVLNGGVLKLAGGASGVSGGENALGPITLLAASTIEKEAHCCVGNDLSGAISGSGKLTIHYLDQLGSGSWNITGNNTFTGGADFLAGVGYEGEANVANVALAANGPPGTPNTLSIYPNFRLVLGDGGTLVRDFTLAGGTLVSRNRSSSVTGTLTLTAASQVKTDGCCNGGGLTINGPVVGGDELTANPTFNHIWFAVASPGWTGGLRVTGNGSYQTVIQATDAQGTGAIRVDNGQTLAFDATANQNWDIGNTVKGRGTVRVEDGVGNHRLTLRGNDTTPGDTTGAAGKLTVDGKASFADNGGTYATLTIDVVSTDANAGVGYDQLVVDHGDATLAASIANCDLVVNCAAPLFTSLAGQSRTVVLASGADFSSGGAAFHSVTWSGPVGTLHYNNGAIVIEFASALPIVNNASGATGVSATQATLNGNLTDLGGSPPVTVGVSWGDEDGGDTGPWDHTEWFPAPASVGPFQTTVSISSGVPYWYRFRAVNGAGEGWAPSSETFIFVPTVVSVTATDASASENGTNPGEFTFARTATSGTLAVGYTITGSAENIVDYTLLSGTASFADGEATAVVPVTPVFDAVPEGAQTVHVAINAGGYEVGTPNEAEVTIADAAEILFANNGNWSVAVNWNPATVPSGAQDLGVVPAGKTATANTDLGATPTIRIDAGGRVNQSTDLSTPIVLNGGVFHNTGFMNTASPITLLADSTIEKTAHCCNGKSFSGIISGGGKLTFKWLSQFDPTGPLNFIGNNTFSGGADFLAGPTYTGKMYVGVSALSTNGPLGSPNTVRVSTNVLMVLNGSLTRDFTLDGGTLSSENNTPIITGTLTLTADSRLMTAGSIGSGMSIQGALVGPYEVTMNPTYQDLTLKVASPLWTGGLLATGSTYKTVVQVSGAQGAGPIRVASGSTLAFDATVDQDWTVSNPIEVALGTIQVESGSRQISAADLTVGTGATVPGRLTVTGNLRLTGPLGARLNGNAVYDGTNPNSGYSRLLVNGTVDLNGQSLSAAFGFEPLAADELFLLLNDGTDAIVGQFQGMPEGSQIDTGSDSDILRTARITYQANGDGGSVGNDIKLYGFTSRARATVLIFE